MFVGKRRPRHRETLLTGSQTKHWFTSCSRPWPNHVGRRKEGNGLQYYNIIQPIGGIFCYDKTLQWDNWAKIDNELLARRRVPFAVPFNQKNIDQTSTVGRSAYSSLIKHSSASAATTSGSIVSNDPVIVPIAVPFNQKNIDQASTVGRSAYSSLIKHSSASASGSIGSNDPVVTRKNHVHIHLFVCFL